MHIERIVMAAVAGFVVGIPASRPADATPGPGPAAGPATVRVAAEPAGAWDADADVADLAARVRALEMRTRLVGPGAPGWWGGAEVMFFEPFGTARSQVEVLVDDVGLQPAWRLWGGFSNAEGLGVGVRWWQYDQTTPLAGASISLVFQKLDLVVSQRIEARRWDALVFAGPTYAGNGLGYRAPDIEPRQAARWRFDGAGLTVGAQLIRDTPWLRGLALAAGVQGSAVFGPSVMPDGFTYHQPATCATIFELSCGPRWERGLRGGATAFAGAACEAQYWTTGLASFSSNFIPSVGSGGGDIGLVGFTCNVGIRR